MPKGAQVAIASIAATAVACTLAYSTTSLTGGTYPDTDSGDVAVGGEDGGGPGLDGGSETSMDAPADVATDGRVAPFCKSLAVAPTFCRDFDDGASFSGAFVLDVGSGNQLMSDTMASSSPLTSLLAAIPANSASDLAYMYRAFPNVVGDVRLAFDIFLQAGSASGGAVAAGFRLSDSETQSLIFFLGDGIAGVEEQYKYSGSARAYKTMTFVTGVPPVGAWTRIEIHTVVNPAPRVTVTSNGQVVVDDTLHSSWVTSNPVLLLGIRYLPTAAQTVPWALRFDNVVFDLH